MTDEIPVIVSVSGVTDAEDGALREIVGRAVGQQGGGGAALCVIADGEPMVDLFAGTYTADSLQYLYSVTKFVTAIAAAMAHQEGLLDLDAPVSDYWPAMRRASTRAITARSVLSHRSGLASIDRRLTLDELLAHVDEEAIETQEPYWEPGIDHGYHGFTYGTLMNAIFRRAVGSTVAEFVQTRIAEPHGVDLWIGAPASELHRIEPITMTGVALTSPQADHFAQMPIPPTAHPRRQPDGSPTVNLPRMQQIDWPASSGVASARALARLAALLLTGSLIPTTSVDRMARQLSRGTDRVLGFETAFGSGVQLPFPLLPMLGPRSIGHEGAGGCVVVADLDSGVALAWTTSVYASTSGAAPGYFQALATVRDRLARV
jgi:CubicO group peptidase (beta-lactamase class C family)